MSQILVSSCGSSGIGQETAFWPKHTKLFFFCETIFDLTPSVAEIISNPNP